MHEYYQRTYSYKFITIMWWQREGKNWSSVPWIHGNYTGIAQLAPLLGKHPCRWTFGGMALGELWWYIVHARHDKPCLQMSTRRHSTYEFYQAFHRVSCDWGPRNEARGEWLFESESANCGYMLCVFYYTPLQTSGSYSLYLLLVNTLCHGPNRLIKRSTKVWPQMRVT